MNDVRARGFSDLSLRGRLDLALLTLQLWILALLRRKYVRLRFTRRAVCWGMPCITREGARWALETKRWLPVGCMQSVQPVQD